MTIIKEKERNIRAFGKSVPSTATGSSPISSNRFSIATAEERDSEKFKCNFSNVAPLVDRAMSPFSELGRGDWVAHK